MEQRISLVTLGVDDLERAIAFYSALGWQGSVVQETAFFQAGSVVVVLWSRGRLAADLGVDDTPAGFGGMALAHNVRSRRDVDDVIAVAEAAGATITRRPHETFYGGYAGVFRDPDGHPWEIAHNPGLPLGDDGSMVLPDDFGDCPEHYSVGPVRPVAPPGVCRPGNQAHGLT